MSTPPADYSEMKAALKDALVELLQERRELFHDLLKEIIDEGAPVRTPISVTVPRPQTATDVKREEAVEREIRAFHRLHPTLLEHHLGQYVAIHDQHLVDHDADKLALYQRIRNQYPEQFVLVRLVEPEPERELYFRSTHYFVNGS